jgi:protein-tyrosine kinase
MTDEKGFIARALRRRQRRGGGAAVAEPAADAVTHAVPHRGAPLEIDGLARYGIPLPGVERSRAVEEFRLIKRNLLRAWSTGEAGGDPPARRSILVASAWPGEGKTFVALGLALAFAAEADGEALLVDTDTHHPLLEAYFRCPTGTGLVDVLEGRRELADVVLATSRPKLVILPAGRGGPQVPELLASERMPALLAEMTAHRPNRVVVIDTPPCLASSDAATLAPMVGQIVLVVEAHRTQRQEIESALAVLGGGQRISLLLNKCDRTASEHFGSYEYRHRDSDEPPAAERR